MGQAGDEEFQVYMQELSPRGKMLSPLDVANRLATSGLGRPMAMGRMVRTVYLGVI